MANYKAYHSVAFPEIVIHSHIHSFSLSLSPPCLLSLPPCSTCMLGIESRTHGVLSPYYTTESTCHSRPSSLSTLRDFFSPLFASWTLLGLHLLTSPRDTHISLQCLCMHPWEMLKMLQMLHYLTLISVLCLLVLLNRKKLAKKYFDVKDAA